MLTGLGRDEARNHSGTTLCSGGSDPGKTIPRCCRRAVKCQTHKGSSQQELSSGPSVPRVIYLCPSQQPWSSCRYPTAVAFLHTAARSSRGRCRSTAQLCTTLRRGQGCPMPPPGHNPSKALQLGSVTCVTPSRNILPPLTHRAWC